MLTSYKIDILSEVGYTKTHISSKIRSNILTDLKQRPPFILKPFKNVRGLRLVWAVFSETKSKGVGKREDPRDSYYSEEINLQLLKSNCKLTRKKFRDFNGIRTHGFCVSAVVLYQLSSS